MKHLFASLVVFAVLLASTAYGQTAPSQQPLPTVNRTYFFAQSLTNPFPTKKSEENFRKLLDDFTRFLRENKVAVVNDASSSYSLTEVPLQQLLQTARNSGATTLLHVTIDVPAKSIALTATAYALDGTQIWQSTGSCDTADKTPMDVCMKVVTETVHEALKFRIKMEDLPILAEGKK